MSEAPRRQIWTLLGETVVRVGPSQAQGGCRGRHEASPEEMSPRRPASEDRMQGLVPVLPPVTSAVSSESASWLRVCWVHSQNLYLSVSPPVASNTCGSLSQSRNWYACHFVARESSKARGPLPGARAAAAPVPGLRTGGCRPRAVCLLRPEKGSSASAGATPPTSGESTSFQKLGDEGHYGQ